MPPAELHQFFSTVLCVISFGKPFYFLGFPFKITPNPALIELHIFLKWELKGKAQAEVEEAEARRVVVAARHTAVPGDAAPATAPVHTVGAR